MYLLFTKSSLTILTIMKPKLLPIPAPLTPKIGINIKLKIKLVIVPKIVVKKILLVSLAAKKIVPKKADISEKIAANNKKDTNFQAS